MMDVKPSQDETILHRLRAHAEASPDGLAIHFLNYDGSADKINFVELGQHSQSFAAELRRKLCPGARVRFIQENSLLIRPKEKYDLIWFVGINIYFPDRDFIQLIIGSEIEGINLILQFQSTRFMGTNVTEIRTTTPSTLSV